MSKFRFRAWPTESKMITQHFGSNPGDYARFGLPGHEGIDLAATVGSNVFAVAAGTVEHVFPDDGRPYGNNVRVRHADGYETIYAHLARATVAEGQKVKAGQVVGLAGETGNVTGPHLHLTLKQAGATFGGYPHNIIDPSPFLLPLLDPQWDDATFVRDLVPDGTVFQAGQPFTQTWFLRNTGNRPWQPGYALVCINGPTLAPVDRVPVPAIPVAAEASITLAMTAPTTAGSYVSVWQIHDDQGNPFGDPVWVMIEVATAHAATSSTNGDFIRVVGREFRRNGQPFRFFGYNLRGLAHYGRRSSDPLMFSRREHQESQLRRVYDLGARVVRIFLPDRDVAASEIEGRLRELLRLVDKFPGLYLLPAFTNLYGDVPFHHPGDHLGWLFQDNLLARDFFAGRYQENYLPFVKQIVSAFREEVSIFAWEIGNELKLDRANKSDANDPNPWEFVRFNQAVAAAIKSIDPNHLVTTGMKSTHHAWLHSVALQDELYRAPNIDFVTIHSYEGKFDRDGDLRVYEDASVAARCNKPFIVEEAGFDRELFSDRVTTHREHIEKWLHLGASGYMPWGFIHAREIGDGDNSVGISAEHGDFQPLCDLFRNYAGHLNAGSRGLSPFFRPLPAAFPQPRGTRSVTGFDFQGYNQHFLNTGHPDPLNDAMGYGVGVHSVNAALGATYWRVIGIHHLTPDENQRRHNIYVDVLDEQGHRLRDALVVWNWEDNNAAAPAPKGLDKPDNEPGTDIPISNGTFKVAIGGAPSEEVFGLHYRHADENASDGTAQNTYGHHSFYVVFQRARKGVAQPVESEPAVVIPPPSARPNTTSGRAARKIGIDANAPIDESSGRISDQVNNPNIIAGAGVGWVRLNFIIGPWQDPHDQNRPFGLTWQETYRKIIGDFTAQGLKVYGLISDQALRDKPGGRLRRAPDGNLLGDGWVQNYARTFVDMARMFGDQVQIFESFNEPDDWKRGEQPDWSDANPNWIHPAWFATMLQAIHQAVRSDPSLSHIRLVSGPLQGMDNNGNAGHRYLALTYQEGKARYDWGQPGVPFPFDGVGYHLYIAEGERQNVSVELQKKYNHYMGEVRAVIQAAEGVLKPIYISEIGWANDGGLDHLQQEAMNSAFAAVLDDASVALGIWFCTQDFPGKPYGLYRQGGLGPDQRKAIHDRLLAICNQERILTTFADSATTITARLLDDATYVDGKDLIVDGTKLLAGERFTQSWSLRNSGQTTWGSGYKLVWIGGPSMEAAHQVSVPLCTPGSEVAISVSFVAPSAIGLHRSVWRMCNEHDELFGQPVWVEINVVATRHLLPLAPAAPAMPAAHEPEVSAALRQLTLTGIASTQRILEQLVNNLGATPPAPLAESLTLAALGVAYQAYWAQVASMSDVAHNPTQLRSAAAETLSQLQALLAQHQSRGGGVPTATQPLLPLPPAPVHNNSSGSTPRKRALCIGIDDYSQQPLSGCVADARLWANTLVALGFAQPQLLLNQQATRNAILAAITELVSSSQPGDVIVIQYAGHGTQLRDVSGDEAGGDTPQKDEALVPFDFLSGAYVIDDDLSAIFRTIRAGVNVTCFMDCCHSGSNTRFMARGDERPRFMVATEEMLAAYRHYRQQLGGSRSTGKRNLEDMAEVVFAACQSTELAWESSGHGEFTLRATEILKNGAGSLSHEAFMRQVTAAFGLAPRQNPLLECASAARRRTLLQAVAV